MFQHGCEALAAIVNSIGGLLPSGYADLGQHDFHQFIVNRRTALGAFCDESTKRLEQSTNADQNLILEGSSDHREDAPNDFVTVRSEEHTSELQSLMRISYAVFCLKKKT